MSESPCERGGRIAGAYQTFKYAHSAAERGHHAVAAGLYDQAAGQFADLGLNASARNATRRAGLERVELRPSAPVNVTALVD